MNELEEILAARFPAELVETSAFEKFHDRLLDEIRGPAISVVERLESRLQEEEREIRAIENVFRDHWGLFGDLQPVKPASSARFKLARDIKESEGGVFLERPTLSIPELRERLLDFSDLARCRIVCSFNQDVQFLLNRIVRNDLFLDAYPIRGGVKDFVFKPERRGVLKGHRARQLSFRVGEDGTGFFFEVQLMTVLQHGWDRRNHPLYEWMRLGKILPDELRVNDFACSETLHLVDRQAEQNWADFLSIMKGGK